jgi:insertion element IS1 protein InsB
MYQQHNCPACGSTNVIKNGSTYYGKARLKCKPCGRQFVHMRTYQPLSNECKRRIELMLAERISLEAICRVMEIAAHQLYTYIDELYGETPADLGCSVINHSGDIELVRLNSELDELWSFVGYKANKQWLWVALDRASRQIIALFVGNRGVEGALSLWQALPEPYREKAHFYSDDWRAYKQIIPTQQHHFSKHKKDTNHVERFFCTLRQRCSRMVRLSLSFSKKLDRHVQSIKFVITHYNLSLQI